MSAAMINRARVRHGLRPLTNYTIRVSVLNGVSDQDTAGEEGRRCEVTATTGDISKYVNSISPLAIQNVN